MTKREFRVVNLTTGQSFTERYRSFGNVIRYGLRKDQYEAGQYDIWATDNLGNRTGASVRAYKRAP